MKINNKGISRYFTSWTFILIKYTVDNPNKSTRRKDKPRCGDCRFECKKN